MLKTIAMSIGDLGYDDLFRQPTQGSSEAVPGVPFPEISYILWIMFIILMPVLFSNLLVIKLCFMHNNINRDNFTVVY